MKKVLAGLCVAATMATVSGAALAADNSFYGALDLGQSKAKDACTPPAGVTVTSCSDTDNAYRLGLGYQFNQNFGLEANYVDFGKATATGTVLGVPFASDASVTAFQLSATGSLPFNESFAVIGKIGAAHASVDASATALGITAAASANSTELTYGIGVRYNINKTMAIRAQYEDFGTVGDPATTGDSKLSLISIGMTFGF